jgi:hypothetical protein
VLVVVAAVQFDPSKANGLDPALKALAGQPFGMFLLASWRSGSRPTACSASSTRSTTGSTEPLPPTRAALRSSGNTRIR